jgi:hypothetical protein
MISEYLEDKISNELLKNIYLSHFNNNNLNECMNTLNLSLEIYNNINDYEMKLYILIRLRDINEIIIFFKNNNNNTLPFFFKSEYLNKINDINILFNPKEEYRYFCNKCFSIIKDLKLPELKLNLKYEAVIFEFRKLEHLEFIIKNAILKIGNTWSFTIVCGNLNYDYIMNIFGNINIKIIKLDIDNLVPKTYAKYLCTTECWELFTGDKILVYEEDSYIFKSNIMDFIEWDYIGAPWPNKPDNNLSVGNSGLCLITRKLMIQLLNTIVINNDDYFPHDVFIARHMNKIGKIADFKSALKFSSEGLLNENSFGCHALFNYHIKWRSLIYNNLINYYNKNNKLLLNII